MLWIWPVGMSSTLDETKNESVPRPAFPLPVSYGALRLKSRYLLSPLAGFTNLPFRRITHEIGGVGLTTTDLVNARALIEQSKKTLELIETCQIESPFAVQIFGSEPKIIDDAIKNVTKNGGMK